MDINLLTKSDSAVRHKLPAHIEAFDNSHLFGREAVGCMVCYINGEKNHEHYRRFKIRSKLPERGGSDFTMMEESVYRRLRQIKRDPAQTPDLILLDGAKGQISAVLPVLSKYDIDLPVFGNNEPGGHTWAGSLI